MRKTFKILFITLLFAIGLIANPAPVPKLNIAVDSYGLNLSLGGGQAIIRISQGARLMTIPSGATLNIAGTLTVTGTTTFTTVTITNINAGASGTAGSFKLYPATASKGYLALTVNDQTGNTAVSIDADAMGQASVFNMGDPGAAACYFATSTLQLTLAEMDRLDGITEGTALASKALIADASIDIAGINVLSAASLNIGVTGGGGGTLDLFPTGPTLGKLEIVAADSAGDTTTTITNASQAGARTYTIPDAGASANFLLSQGAQSVVGAQTFTGLFSADQDDTTDGIVNNVTLSHTSSDDNATAADGVGISVELENATGTSTVEEWFSFDFLSTTITDGSEDGDLVINAMLGGTVAPALTIDASDQSITLGANSTDANGIHQLRIFPVTASMGSMLINAVANAADHLITIQNVSHGQATVYSLQDAGGATADIVALAAGITTAGELKRADLTEEVLQIYGIPIYSLRAADLAAMAVAETAGDHYLLLTTDELTLVSEISNNESETSVSWFQFIIPPEYVAAGDCKVRIKHSLFGAGTDGAGGSTVDIAVFEQDGNGATGSDLSTTTAATTITKGSWATTDFVITAAGFVAGDILNVKLTTVVTENASSDLQAELDGLAILLDIKG